MLIAQRQGRVIVNSFSDDSVMFASRLGGEEHRSTGTSPVVAGVSGCGLLARSIARRGQAPSWRACPVVVCWRGASLDGDKPRRGVRVRLWFAGEEHRSTGTSPVVAYVFGWVLLARSIAQRGQAPLWRTCSGGVLLARSIAQRGQAPLWRCLSALPYDVFLAKRVFPGMATAGISTSPNAYSVGPSRMSEAIASSNVITSPV